MILFIENLKNPFKKLSEMMSSIGLQDIRSIYKNESDFYTITMNDPKMKTIPLNLFGLFLLFTCV